MTLNQIKNASDTFRGVLLFRVIKMACHCAERREVIVLAARLAMRGHIEAIPQAADFVVRTIVEDAKASAKASIAAARRRIGRART